MVEDGPLRKKEHTPFNNTGRAQMLLGLASVSCQIYLRLSREAVVTIMCELLDS
jgi:hypothetical protein